MKSINLFALCLAFVGVAAFAAPTSCPNHYAGGVAPDVLNPKMKTGLRELCSEGFVVGHSALVRVPLWSAEHITAAHVSEQKGMRRENVFHTDSRIPAADRAELQDYAGSGFDRGHMTPSASAWNMRVQEETFALSNMVPQDAENNRGLHAHIEIAVRDYALRNGDIYVITGPLFKADKLRWLNRRVAVPTHIFKLVYDPRKRQAAAYLEVNASGDAYKEISVAELEEMAGIKFFPNASVVGKLALPKPVDHGRDHGGSRSKGGSNFGDAKKIVKSFLRGM